MVLPLIPEVETVLAESVRDFDAKDPLDGLAIEQCPTPMPDGWTTVRVAAASLNHHDLWSSRDGANLERRERTELSEWDLPPILGSHTAGSDEPGQRVTVYPVIKEPAPSGESGARSSSVGVLFGRYDGLFAERGVVPVCNSVRIPQLLSFAEVACLPAEWLTAHRMLFTDASLSPGHIVLIQRAGRGLSAALIMLRRAARLTVWVTGRTEVNRIFAESIGASAVFPSGSRLAHWVDAVRGSVGEATWPHSFEPLRTSGTIVVPGGTGGYSATADLSQIFAMSLRHVGSFEHMRCVVTFVRQGKYARRSSVWSSFVGSQVASGSTHGRYVCGKIVLSCS